MFLIYKHSGNLSTALGLETTVTDSKNIKNNYVYGMYGRLTKNSLENTGEIEYDYDKGILSSITRTRTDEGTQVYKFAYDESGSIIGFSLWYEGDTAWTVYYFLKNLQGDVIQIYKSSNNEVVAEYTYDSWGNVLSATGTLAEMNPFRYRGYYYDVETGFYYLKSHYYKCAIERIVNADDWERVWELLRKL